MSETVLPKLFSPAQSHTLRLLKQIITDDISTTNTSAIAGIVHSPLSSSRYNHLSQRSEGTSQRKLLSIHVHAKAEDSQSNSQGRP